jgi:hypothetical protein
MRDLGAIIAGILVIIILATIIVLEMSKPYVEVYQSYSTGECKYIKIDGVTKPCSELVTKSYDEHIWVK